MDSELIKIKRALLSVSDKTSLEIIAVELNLRGIEILASGNTAKYLIEKSIPVTEIADYTQSPEIMGGRVKTLHPRVHAGILARRDNENDLKELTEIGAKPIDLVVVNLYPFEKNIPEFNNNNKTNQDMLELIDIGGPTLVRAAAKNHPFVVILTSPEHYGQFLEEFKSHSGISKNLSRFFAMKAFEHTAAYDAVISNWFERSNSLNENSFSDTFVRKFEKKQDLKYGENPHLKAAFYREITGQKTADIANAEQLHGQKLSYNNILDCDAALSLAREFTEPAVVIIKHTNPCGAAVSDSIIDAFEKAKKADETSAFGGIISLNRIVDLELMKKITQSDNFFECIVAPDYSAEAIEHVKNGEKWVKRFRVLKTGDFNQSRPEYLVRGLENGLLVQSLNKLNLDETNLKCVTKRQPTDKEKEDLLFGWLVCKHTKSNAIIFVKDKISVGTGAGQMSRVDSVRLAAIRAGNRAEGSVLASDAFFPFADGIELAHESGVTAVIQPGGSIRDKTVIEKCNELNIAMLFTGNRHFRH